MKLNDLRREIGQPIRKRGVVLKTETVVMSASITLTKPAAIALLERLDRDEVSLSLFVRRLILFELNGANSEMRRWNELND